MNLPPTTAIRVSHTKLQDFVTRAGRESGLPEEKAALLAELLTTNVGRGRCVLPG